jgi:DNA-directed RNA polymerase III subunit RPC2
MSRCRFLSIRVGEPRPDESGAACGRLTPMACRLRDITYAAPIFVDVDFLKGEKVIRRKNVEIGR